jgi:hypothetical protein
MPSLFGRRRSPEAEAQRHISAARAFHTGLVAETHRRLRSLRDLAVHIDVLRHSNRQPAEKLAAVKACDVHLATLERLTRPWRDTYRDLRQSLRRARTILEQIVTHAERQSGRR